MSFRRVLVLGGARSGKSGFAERLAVECGEPVVYVATATVTDDEMAERIAHHRERRPRSWLTLEAPVALGERLAAERLAMTTLIVEDLTLLLYNHFQLGLDGAETRVSAEVEALLGLDAHVIVVSNEVGMGIVPEYALSRAFRDALGRINQHAAALATEVVLTVAGLPLRLK